MSDFKFKKKKKFFLHQRMYLYIRFISIYFSFLYIYNIYIYIYILLRGVENRDIFFMYITRCVSFARIIPRRRIKLEKEAPNEPFLITRDSRLKEEEMELQVNPFPLFTHLS